MLFFSFCTINEIAIGSALAWARSCKWTNLWSWSVTVAQKRCHVSAPVQPDKGNVMGRQPTQHVQAYAAGAIDYDNPSRLIPIGWEKPVLLDSLRIMGKAVLDN